MQQVNETSHTEAQSFVNDIQCSLDHLARLGSTCSVIFTWNGSTHKVDGVTGGEFGARAELAPKSRSKASAIVDAKDKDFIENELEEAASSLQDESERLRAILSAISMFSRSDEPSAMRDIDKLADIGRCSSTVMAEIGNNLREIIPEQG